MATPTYDELKTGCHAWVDGVENVYHYVPSIAAGIVFTLLFLLSAIGHVFRYVSLRLSASILLALGAVIELIGWAARIWSSRCPYNDSSFKTQVTLLVIGPVFFTAAIYLFLSQLIRYYGDALSLLKPKAYLWIFILLDVLSLIIQAAGAGIASSQLGKPNGNSRHGTNVVAGGIIFQLASMTVFTVCFAVFLRRLYSSASPASTPPVRVTDRQLICAIVFSLVVIYIRNIFRAAQLIQGFTGNLFVHEGYFIGLDGVMMLLAVVVFNLVDLVQARTTKAQQEASGEQQSVPQEMERLS